MVVNTTEVRGNVIMAVQLVICRKDIKNVRIGMVNKMTNYTHIMKDSNGEHRCKFVSDNMIIIEGEEEGTEGLCRVYTDTAGKHSCTVEKIKNV